MSLESLQRSGAETCEIATRRNGDRDSALQIAAQPASREGIINEVDGVLVNGYEPNRLPHMTNLSFEGVEHDELLGALRAVAVSSGSACTSASLEPSYVLSALGLPERLAFPSLRFALGKRNTREEVEFVIDCLSHTVGRLRGQPESSLAR